MNISVYNTLPQCAEKAIRWPGVEAFGTGDQCNNLAALSVLLDEETSGATEDRFMRSRLLMRNWTKFLHEDRTNIFLSDEPRLSSRVRTYKGLVCPECSTAAITFDQLEVPLERRSSVLINRIEIDSAAPVSCLIPLGDTFRSFAVSGWYNSHDGDQQLSKIASCYRKERGIWRWDSSLLLPLICVDQSVLFFLRRVAHETILQMIIYLPQKQVSSHLKLARAQFNAQVSFIT